jgi:hypothetical protein
MAQNRDLPLLVGRNFDSVDTWTVLLIYVLSGAVAVTSGFLASGRGRNWSTFFLQSQFFALLGSLAQWSRITDHDLCHCDVFTIDGTQVELCSTLTGKQCGGIVGATSLLYLLNLFVDVGYFWAYLTLSKEFRTAFWLNVVRLLFSVAQLVVSAVIGSVAASILQSIVLLSITWFFYVLWKAPAFTQRYEDAIRQRIENAASVSDSSRAIPDVRARVPSHPSVRPSSGTLPRDFIGVGISPPLSSSPSVARINPATRVQRPPSRPVSARPPSRVFGEKYNLASSSFSIPRSSHAANTSDEYEYTDDDSLSSESDDAILPVHTSSVHPQRNAYAEPPRARSSFSFDTPFEALVRRE